MFRKLFRAQNIEKKVTIQCMACGDCFLVNESLRGGVASCSSCKAEVSVEDIVFYQFKTPHGVSDRMTPFLAMRAILEGVVTELDFASVNNSDWVPCASIQNEWPKELHTLGEKTILKYNESRYIEFKKKKRKIASVTTMDGRENR